jgi:hypothetical protein
MSVLNDRDLKDRLEFFDKGEAGVFRWSSPQGEKSFDLEVDDIGVENANYVTFAYGGEVVAELRKDGQYQLDLYADAGHVVITIPQRVAEHMVQTVRQLRRSW